METLNRQLARQIKQRRGQATQTEFARKLGIAVSSLNRIEQGQQNVTLKMLDKLCKSLKCRVQDLFDARGAEIKVKSQ